jgi:hypothetical protein
MYHPALRYPRRPVRRLAWPDELKLAALRRIIRAEKELHRWIRWALPIREWLVWAPLAAGLAGLAFGLLLRLAYP